MQWSLAADEPSDVVGDHLRVRDFGVVGGAADVRGQHHVVHVEQGMTGRQLLAVEVVESGAAEMA